jgi:type I restriction-modification system DNA methylase subunit
MVSRALRELSEEDVRKVVEVYESYKLRATVGVAGFARAVSRKALEEQAFIMTPGRYIELVSSCQGEAVDKEGLLREYERVLAEGRRLDAELLARLRERVVPKVERP